MWDRVLWHCGPWPADCWPAPHIGLLPTLCQRFFLCLSPSLVSQNHNILFHERKTTKQKEKMQGKLFFNIASSICLRRLFEGSCSGKASSAVMVSHYLCHASVTRPHALRRTTLSLQHHILMCPILSLQSFYAAPCSILHPCYTRSYRYLAAPFDFAR